MSRHQTRHRSYPDAGISLSFPPWHKHKLAYTKLLTALFIFLLSPLQWSNYGAWKLSDTLPTRSLSSEKQRKRKWNEKKTIKFCEPPLLSSLSSFILPSYVLLPLPSLSEVLFSLVLRQILTHSAALWSHTSRMKAMFCPLTLTLLAPSAFLFLFQGEKRVQCRRHFLTFPASILATGLRRIFSCKWALHFH